MLDTKYLKIFRLSIQRKIPDIGLEIVFCIFSQRYLRLFQLPNIYIRGNELTYTYISLKIDHDVFTFLINSFKQIINHMIVGWGS